MCSPQPGTPREVHRVTQRREEGGRRQRWQGGEKGVSKGERQIQPVISSLSVLHSPEPTKRFTELGIEEKGEGGDIGDLLLKTMSFLSGCLMSSASIQKLFCGICSTFTCSFNEFVGEKVVSPSYSSAILGPPPMPIFWRVLIINGCWILSKVFSASTEIIIWLLSIC